MRKQGGPTSHSQAEGGSYTVQNGANTPLPRLLNAFISPRPTLLFRHFYQLIYPRRNNNKTAWEQHKDYYQLPCPLPPEVVFALPAIICHPRRKRGLLGPNHNNCKTPMSKSLLFLLVCCVGTFASAHMDGLLTSATYSHRTASLLVIQNIFIYKGVKQEEQQ